VRITRPVPGQDTTRYEKYQQRWQEYSSETGFGSRQEGAVGGRRRRRADDSWPTNAKERGKAETKDEVEHGPGTPATGGRAEAGRGPTGNGWAASGDEGARGWGATREGQGGAAEFTGPKRRSSGTDTRAPVPRGMERLHNTDQHAGGLCLLNGAPPGVRGHRCASMVC